ncbi:hypothetical protein [Pasteurella sp. PK-2025]|uniref:hypothetical protein n=1 Tax=unclassified Pasteurella TaxID=2621516 RepID=UPI003C75BCB7
MRTQIPGTAPLEEGREFRYIEYSTIKKFEKELFYQLFNLEQRNATNGGVISENCEITTKNGIKFYGISYRGDIIGWRKDFEQSASNLELRYAKINNNQLIDSKGNIYPLDECRIEFY